MNDTDRTKSDDTRYIPRAILIDLEPRVHGINPHYSTIGLI